MGQQCDTCAFKTGCVTHENEPHNRLRGIIASLGGIPFYCHHSPAGDWHDLHLGKLNQAEALALRKEMPICEGWRVEVKALALRGHFRDDPKRVRRFIAVYALKCIDRFIKLKGKPKDRAVKELGRSLELLKEKTRAL